MRETDRHPGELSDVLPVYYVIDSTKWINKELVDRWCRKMWDMFVAMESDFEEPLDGLSAVAQWFVDYRDRFDRQQAETLEENLARAVIHEIEYNTEYNDPERLGGDLATVEEIAKTLKRDFSDETRWLNESLAECGPSDIEDLLAEVKTVTGAKPKG